MWNKREEGEERIGDLNVRKVKEGAHGMAPSLRDPNEKRTKTLMMKKRDRLRPICPNKCMKRKKKNPKQQGS